MKNKVGLMMVGLIFFTPLFTCLGLLQWITIPLCTEIGTLTYNPESVCYSDGYMSMTFVWLFIIINLCALLGLLLLLDRRNIRPFIRYTAAIAFVVYGLWISFTPYNIWNLFFFIMP
jgi:hypothetical protein